MSHRRVPMPVLNCQDEELRKKAIKIYTNPKSTQEEQAEVYREIKEQLVSNEKQIEQERLIRAEKQWKKFMDKAWTHGGWF